MYNLIQFQQLFQKVYPREKQLPVPQRVKNNATLVLSIQEGKASLILIMIYFRSLTLKTQKPWRKRKKLKLLITESCSKLGAKVKSCLQKDE